MFSKKFVTLFVIALVIVVASANDKPKQQQPQKQKKNFLDGFADGSQKVINNIKDSQFVKKIQNSSMVKGMSGLCSKDREGKLPASAGKGPKAGPSSAILPDEASPAGVVKSNVKVFEDKTKQQK